MTLALPKPSLRETLDAHLRSLVTPRADWQHAHISDLYACDYETYARRSSSVAPVENCDAASALKMTLGNDIEGHVAHGLSAFYGESFERGERIAWNPYTMQTRRLLLEAGHPEGLSGPIPCDGCYHCQPLDDEIVGHLDGVSLDAEGEETVWEIKSTSRFSFRKAVNETLAGTHHYATQAAGYAVAIDAKAAGVIVVDRDSCSVEGPLWLDLDALREPIIARAKEVLERTSPDSFPPPPSALFGWQPKYCDLGAACACKGRIV